MRLTAATRTLSDPARLLALAQTELLDAPPDPILAGFTRLVTRLLGTPGALISLVAADRQFFAGALGVPEPWATRRETPLSYSFCRYVVQRGRPLMVADARQVPRLAASPVISDLGIVAYAGAPLVTPDGYVLGALCAIDPAPHTWSQADLACLQDLAAGVMATIQLRREQVRHQQTLAALQQAEAARDQFRDQLETAHLRTEALYQTARSLIESEPLAEVLQFVVDSTARVLPAEQVTAITLDLETHQVTHCVTGGPDPDPYEADFAELDAGLTGWVLRTGLPAISPKGRPDPRESLAVQARRAATNCGGVLVVPLTYRGQVLGTLTAANREDQPDFTVGDSALLTALAHQAAAAIAQAQRLQVAQHQAGTDELTGLANRREFLARATREVTRAQRLDRPLAFMLLDIDRFKTVNDTYGHPVGDTVLREVAARCQAGIRAIDLLGRIGGEEFAILLPETPLALATQVAERVRQAVANQPIATARGDLTVTISIGVAAGAGLDLPALLARADAALYAAKAGGRNCVVVV
jgi:diguanylate cyclase (GGDEF)-like protein